jgi:hypothetical protein
MNNLKIETFKNKKSISIVGDFTMASDLIGMLREQLVFPIASVLLWLLLALVIMVIFWLISKAVKRIVVQILQSFGVDAWVEEHKISTAIGNKKVSEVLGSLAKWYFIVFGLAVVVETPGLFGKFLGFEILPMPGLSEFLWTLAKYLPMALGGVLFFVLALLFAKYLGNQILVIQHKLKGLAAGIVEGLIIIFAAVVALQMILGNAIAQTILQLLQIFIQPFIVALAIVFGIVAGLAAGLAFKEDLQKFAKEIKKEFL